MKYNLGHKFETLMAHALKNKGVSFTTKQNAPYLAYSYKDDTLSELLNTFVHKYIYVTEFSIPSHKQNKKSLSADFFNKEQSISCKKDNVALKHPKFGAGLSILTDIQSRKMFDFDPRFYGNRKQFYKDNKIRRKDLFNKFTQLQYDVLKNRRLHYKKVQKLYNFLIGKERPMIVKLESKKNQLWILDTKKFSNPTSCSIHLVENRNGRNQLMISFDNGISIKQRFKSATNSNAKTEWHQLFKEEWTLVSNNAVLKNQKIIKKVVAK